MKIKSQKVLNQAICEIYVLLKISDKTVVFLQEIYMVHTGINLRFQTMCIHSVDNDVD